MALTEALRMTSLSDTGMVRDLNEDRVEFNSEQGIAVLADGMGGYNAGEVASGLAVKTVMEDLLANWTGVELIGLDRPAVIAKAESVLQSAVKKANAVIFDAAQKDAECEGMGTTAVVCLFYDNFLTVAHLGDSRLYRLRDEVLEQVTHDHSLLQEQIDSGMIKKEDAHLSNNRNFVTRAVGVVQDEEAEIHTYDVLLDDIYLLCTDGLFGLVQEEEIQMTMFALRANLDLVAQQLVQSANDAGGNDNVSVILIRVMKDFPADK